MRRVGAIALGWLVALGMVAQEPAQNSEAHGVGLHGPVRSVRTEYFPNQASEPTSSTLNIYDRKGYLLDEYRYDAGGVLHSHTKYTREGWKILKTESNSVVPQESQTHEVEFDERGLVTGEASYDANGVPLEKSHTDIPKNHDGLNAETKSRTTKADGTTSVQTTVEKSDPQTGITRQTITKDGKMESDWLIQRDAKGELVSDVLRRPDGSYNAREVKADGTVVEHKFWAPTKQETWQTTSKDGRVVEVIEQAPGTYGKTTFHYDDAGRVMELVYVDGEGKPFSRTEYKYQDDHFGNWTEQREYQWNREMGTKPAKLSSVVRRILEYY